MAGELPQGGKLDIYDNGGGSITLAWPELINPPATSYDVYMRVVAFVPAFELGANTNGQNQAPFVANAFSPSAGLSAAVPGPWTEILGGSQGSGVSTGAWALEGGGGGLIELEGGSGVFALESSAGSGGYGTGVPGYLATITGLQVASYDSGSQVLIPSLTYDFYVAAVVGGNELMAAGPSRVTPQPSSIALKTRMKRLWPFPNTGLD